MYNKRMKRLQFSCVVTETATVKVKVKKNRKNVNTLTISQSNHYKIKQDTIED